MILTFFYFSGLQNGGNALNQLKGRAVMWLNTGLVILFLLAMTA
jgi:hypothetical protein